MWETLWNTLVELGTTVGLKLVYALILLVVGLKLVKKLQKWMHKAKGLQRIDDSVRSFTVSFVGIVLDIVILISVAMILGVPTTSFVTLLASGGVAIGLAMQGALSNFAGGLMILLFKPFRVGDFIESGDKSGTVQDITVVYTVLLTLDNKHITIPNGTLTNSTVVNYSSEPLRRVDLTFGASYDCDVETVKGVLRETVEAHPLVLSDPEPFVRLSSHDDSALTYTVRAWCKSEDYWTVYFDLLEQAKTAFDKNNIPIPYPQMDVHLDK